MITLPARITDSTGGAANTAAGFTVDDTTSSVKDDLATLAAAYNALHDTVQFLLTQMEAGNP